MKKLFFGLILLAFSCDTNEAVLAPFAGDVVQVKSGQAFGMCIGKCWNEVTITATRASLLQTENQGRGGEQVEHRNDANESLAKLHQLFSKFPSSEFKKLNEFYGCPDCADGGMEWLEVKFSDGSTKKVTIEYGAKLEGFDEIISGLRTERLSLMEKYR
jgi:hypothetical protein